MKAIEPYPHRMWYEYVPCNTRFTFTNGQTSKVDWTLRLHFNTTPRMVTNIDILEQGQVPILFSIDQMRNLHITIEHTPQCDKITCKAFGMNRQPIPVSHSGHALLDLAAFCKQHNHRTATKAFDDDKISLNPYPSLLVSAFPAEAESKQPATPAPSPAADVTETIGHTNNDHWIINHTTKELHRVHVSARRALFAPDTSKTCPIAHTQIYNQRTTKRFNPETKEPMSTLEDNWRIKNKSPSTAELWTGSTIFTFSDKPLTSEQIHIDKPADRIIPTPGRHATEPTDPAALQEAPPDAQAATLPIALKRIHTRLSKPEELRKLHLQHHHMSTEQFKFRTRALHLPKAIYDLYDKIRAECEPCQKASIAPSRSKTSGLRAETFGELTFIDHCQVPLGTGEHINVLVILDGATTLLTTEVVERTTDVTNIPLLRNYFDQYHLQPRCVVGDQAFMTENWEIFFHSLDIRPVSLATCQGSSNSTEPLCHIWRSHSTGISVWTQASRTGPIGHSNTITTCSP